MSSPEEPEESGQPHIKRHPLTPTFREGDAPDETGFETLVGFVGDSPRPSFVRVYADLTFLSYCEVKTSDIQQMAPVDPADDEGPTTVRVRADARIEYVRIDRLAGDASFVAGTIRAMHYGRSAQQESSSHLEKVGDGFPPTQPYPVTPVLYCVSRVFPPCPTPYPITPLILCVSRVFPPCNQEA